MERQSVTIEAMRVVKSYPSAAITHAALIRAEALRAAGLDTPAATRMDATTLAFDRLSGRSGAVLIRDLPTLLAPLAALHCTPVPDLPPHDPFRRIMPRLPLAPATLRARIATLATQPRAMPTATLHGDFHPGQVIATADGTAWLIDLDDMAHGPAEADVGNLLAWCLTAPETRDAPPSGGWRKALVAAWRGNELHPATLSFETEIALVRRALKRFAKGDGTPLERLMTGSHAPSLSDG